MAAGLGGVLGVIVIQGNVGLDGNGGGRGGGRVVMVGQGGGGVRGRAGDLLCGFDVGKAAEGYSLVETSLGHWK